MPANLENSAAATGLERSVFIPIPKKGNAKECSNYCTIALISHASKGASLVAQRLKRLPAMWETRVRSLGWEDLLEKEMATIRWIMEKAREFQKNIYFCFIDYAKSFECVDHNKLWKILKEMGIPEHYLSPEKPVCKSRSNS